MAACLMGWRENRQEGQETASADDTFKALCCKGHREIHPQDPEPWSRGGAVASAPSRSDQRTPVSNQVVPLPTGSIPDAEELTPVGPAYGALGWEPLLEPRLCCPFRLRGPAKASQEGDSAGPPA